MFQLFSAALAVIRPRLTNSRINSRIKPAITFHLPPLSGAFFQGILFFKISNNVHTKGKKIKSLTKIYNQDFKIKRCGRWDLNPHAVSSTRSLV